MLVAQSAPEDRFRLLWTVFRDSRRGHDPAREQAVLAMIAEFTEDTSVGQWARLRVAATRDSEEWAKLRSAILRTAQNDVVAAAAEVVPVSPFQVATAGGQAESLVRGSGYSDDGIQQASGTSPLQVPATQRGSFTRRYSLSAMHPDGGHVKVSLCLGRGLRPNSFRLPRRRSAANGLGCSPLTMTRC